MRPIKFRGKSIDKGETSIAIGEWVYGYLCAPDQIIVWDEKIAVGKCVQVDPETVGEFSGRHDKSGREIYEGQILVPYAYRNVKKEFNGVVIFDKGSFRFRKDSKLYQKSPLLYEVLISGQKANNELIIIGNLHDNPELLEKE